MKIDRIDGILLIVLALLFMAMVGVQGYLWGYNEAKYTDNTVVVHKNCKGHEYTMKGGE